MYRLIIRIFENVCYTHDATVWLFVMHGKTRLGPDIGWFRLSDWHWVISTEGLTLSELNWVIDTGWLTLADCHCVIETEWIIFSNWHWICVKFVLNNKAYYTGSWMSLNSTSETTEMALIINSGQFCRVFKVGAMSRMLKLVLYLLF